MDSEAKGILDDVVRYLNVPGGPAEDLWTVLTALRGPDDDDLALKKATTAVIREKIGLRRDTVGYAVVCKDEPYAVALRKVNDRTLHFSRHSYDAFRALGLDWCSVNK